MKDKEKLSLVIFIALMGTSTLALTSNLIFNNFLTDAFSYILELSIIIEGFEKPPIETSL